MIATTAQASVEPAVTSVVDDEQTSILIEESSIYRDNFEQRLRAAGGDVSYFQLFRQLLTQIQPGIPLYRTPVPTILLSPISILEKLHACPPNLLLHGIENEQYPVVRLIQLLQWRLHGQQEVPRVGVKCSKPYNPILGEVFRCVSLDPYDQSESYCLTEQVSHHPPISAFVEMCPARGDLLSVIDFEPGFKLHFNSVDLITRGNGGHHFLRDFNNEHYLMDGPHCLLSNLFFGRSLTLSVATPCDFICTSTGFAARLEFSTNGEGVNVFSGVIKNPEGEILFEIEGELTGRSLIRAVGSPASHHGDSEEKVLSLWKRYYQIDEDEDDDEEEEIVLPSRTGLFLDYELIRRFSPRLLIQPLHLMEKNESRRVWHSVTRELLREDYVAASAAKFAIEEEQRGVRREREERGEEWIPRYFEWSDEWGCRWPKEEILEFLEEFVKVGLDQRVE